MCFLCVCFTVSFLSCSIPSPLSLSFSFSFVCALSLRLYRSLLANCCVYPVYIPRLSWRPRRRKPRWFPGQARLLFFKLSYLYLARYLVVFFSFFLINNIFIISFVRFEYVARARALEFGRSVAEQGRARPTLRSHN